MSSPLCKGQWFKAYHGSDGELEELSLGRVELIEQRQGLVDHFVVFVVGEVHEDGSDLICVEVSRGVEHGSQLTHTLLL